jgi:hypothetical protein
MSEQLQEIEHYSFIQAIKRSKQPQEWPEGSPVTPWDMSSRDMLMHLSPYHNAALAAERKKVNTLRDIAERLWTQLIGGRKHLTSYEKELRGGLTEAEEAK